MSAYCRVFTTNLCPKSSIKWSTMNGMSMSSRNSRFLLSTRVGHQTDSTHDIKRRVMKRLSPDEDLMSRLYGKEVVIFESTDHTFYRYLSVGSLFQFLVLVILCNVGLFAYVRHPDRGINTTDTTEDRTLSWRQRFGCIYELNKKYVWISLGLVTVGHVVLVAALLYLIRSVNTIVLHLRHTGADSVTIHCYSLFGLPNIYHKHHFPLREVSALTRRTDKSRRFITIQAKDRLLRFRADSRAHFPQPQLFDETIGALRKL